MNLVAHKNERERFPRSSSSTVAIVEMSNQGSRDKASELLIKYSYAETNFGRVIVASTEVGVCHLFFIDDDNQGLLALMQRFPDAKFSESSDIMQANALSLISNQDLSPSGLTLHLQGTRFQIGVWNALLQIPMGAVETYGAIAKKIGNVKASRAVGSAIGKNPVAFVVPCHRVIQASGNVGGYMWGKSRKVSILSWEASQVV